MKKNSFILFLVLLTVNCSVVSAQNRADKRMIADLQKQITILSSDTGKNEKILSQEIASEFKQLGLQPLNDNFLQPFSLDEGKMYEQGTRLMVNSHSLILANDFYPLPYSANSKFSGEPIISIQELNKPWMISCADVMTNAEQGNSSDTGNLFYTRAAQAQANGASAVLFFNASGQIPDLLFNPKDKHDILKVPVLYVKPGAAAKYFSDATASIKLSGEVKLDERIINGSNLAGLMNNNDPYTIIISACNMDISSVAALVELAALLKKQKHPKYNYLFLVYSSKEKELEYNGYWEEHPLISTRDVNYLINLTNIGHQEKENAVLNLEGISTADQWSSIIGDVKEKRLEIFSQAALSDNVPVLFPGKSIPRICISQESQSKIVNYDAELEAVQYVDRLIENTNRLLKLTTSSKENNL